MLPKWNAYGQWPASGEIDIVEARGKNGVLLEILKRWLSLGKNDSKYCCLAAVSGNFIELVSDILLNANLAIFLIYHSENKLIFNEMMMRSALC